MAQFKSILFRRDRWILGTVVVALILAMISLFAFTQNLQYASAVAGDGASSNIQLLDSDNDGDIDRITFDIANPNGETWVLDGAAPHGLSVTQGGNAIDISLVSLTTAATANPVTVQIDLDEGDGDFDETTDGVNSDAFELIYTQESGDNTCSSACIDDSTDEELNTIATGDSGGTDTEIDSAAPVLINPYYSDFDGNGTIGIFFLEWSENVTMTSAGSDDFTITGGDLSCVWNSASDDAGGDAFTSINPTCDAGETGVNGGTEPTIQYEPGNGDPVVDESLANNVAVQNAAAPLTVLDQADPSIASAEYDDTDNDGQIDTATLTWTEFVTDAGDSTAADYTITGGDIGLAHVSGNVDAGGDATTTVAITGDADETGVSGGTEPTIRYAGGGNDPIADESAQTNPGQDGNGAVDFDDAASPVMTLVQYFDSGFGLGATANDGVVDRMRLTWSEVVSLNECENGDYDTDIGDFATFTADCGNNGSGLDWIDIGVTANINQTGVSSGTEPTLEYVDAGTTGSVHDGNGNDAVAQGPLSIVDQAAPVFREVEFQDTDVNGTVDTLQITWTEDVSMNGADGSDFTVTGGDLNLSLTVFNNDNDGNDTTSLGVSADVGETGISATAPTLLYVAGNNDPVQDEEGVDAAAHGDGAMDVDDAADPVILSSDPADGDDGASRTADVEIQFSEAMETTFDEGEGNEFLASPDPGGWSASWSDGDTLLALDHNTFEKDTEYTLTLSVIQIQDATEGDDLNAGGPVDNTITFTTTVSSGGGGGGGGGSSTGTTSTTPEIALSGPTVAQQFQIDSFFDVSFDVSGLGGDSVEIELVDLNLVSHTLATDLDTEGSPKTVQVPAAAALGDATLHATLFDSGKSVLDTASVQVEIVALSLVSCDPGFVLENDVCVAESTKLSAEEIAAGVTLDGEGRKIAPGSGLMGTSPFTGEQEEISSVLPGWYVRSFDEATVYYIDENLERRPFWDGMTFMTWADSWSEVIWVNGSTMATLSLGQPMLPQPGAALVKITSDARVFWVEEDADGSYLLRHITSETVASEMFGADWADYVIDIDPGIYSKYTLGVDMTFAETVDTSKLEKRETIAAQVNS